MDVLRVEGDIALVRMWLYTRFSSRMLLEFLPGGSQRLLGIMAHDRLQVLQVRERDGGLEWIWRVCPVHGKELLVLEPLHNPEDMDVSCTVALGS
jgi:hypothetical protein